MLFCIKQPTNMKKTYRFLTSFTLMAIVCLTSCDKEENGKDLEVELVEPLCKITAISTSSTVDVGADIGYFSSERVFTYELNLLKDVEENFSYETCYTNGEGSEICNVSVGSFGFGFTYEGLLATKVTHYDEVGIKFELTIEYLGNLISKTVYEDKFGMSESRFVYSNGKVSRREFWSYDSSTPKKLVLERYYSFTWSGENIVKNELFEISEEGNEERTHLTTYTFDNMQKPDQFLSFIYTNLGQVHAFSKNNPITSNEIYYSDVEPRSTSRTYAYEYNDKGFPTKITLLDGEGFDEINTLEYNCNL